jgi:uncharacterized protein (TIGR02594 family)
MSEPAWLAYARRDIGRSETLGPNDSPWLRRMWASVSGSWLLGQPWCGGALAWWMQQSGVAYPRAYYRARAWLDWGFPIPLNEPCVGAVAVLGRGGGGHVAIVSGRDARGHLVLVGGNQGNRVSEASFAPARVLGLRWPFEFLSAYYLASTTLPVLAGSASPSRNEA